MHVYIHWQSTDDPSIRGTSDDTYTEEEAREKIIEYSAMYPSLRFTVEQEENDADLQ